MVENLQYNDSQTTIIGPKHAITRHSLPIVTLNTDQQVNQALDNIKEVDAQWRRDRRAESLHKWKDCAREIRQAGIRTPFPVPVNTLNRTS
ncbi:MAG: hypothetical protein WCO06_04540 [Candidatus Roizmanbacteria bacterium]